jgi:uncharacterized protein YjbJ (UPF0337 family)
MNWNEIAGACKQFQGKLKQKWGKLTGNDQAVIAGKRDQRAGTLQQKYGHAKERAEKQLGAVSEALIPVTISNPSVGRS